MQIFGKHLRRLFGMATLRRHACCSFCGQSYDQAAPLVEGLRAAFICGKCAESATKLVDDERSRTGPARGTTLPETRTRARLQFAIRDLLWLTALCALALAWWVDHRRNYRPYYVTFPRPGLMEVHDEISGSNVIMECGTNLGKSAGQPMTNGNGFSP
jgi:hypothetical protein